MNAIIGDNGIITRAQEANIQSSIASLEEFLQLKYTENYEQMAGYQSKIEGLTNVCSSYFYIPAKEGIGVLRYVIDSDGHALYLIKKSGLPEEIRESLLGGDAGEGNYADYQSLNDVYGVTSNLKVYYCSEGADSIKGLARENLDKDNPLRKVFDSESNQEMYNFFKNYDIDSDQTLTAEELKSINELVIDSTSGVTTLEDFFNLSSLKKLTLKNVKLNNLKGIENVGVLKTIFIENCQILDYSSLGLMENRLEYLYLINFTNDELSLLCDGLENHDMTKLEFLGVVGANQEEARGRVSHRTYPVNIRSNLSNIECFSKLTKTTKETIKYLELYRNSLTNVSVLQDFKNLYYLCLDNNNITTLAGLSRISTLQYLHVANNDLGVEETEEIKDNDALSSLQNLNLYFLNLSYNKNLKHINYLSNMNTLRYVYLDNCGNIISADVFAVKKILLGCENYSIDSKYNLSLLDESTSLLNLSEETISKNVFQELRNYKKLTALCLTNVKLIGEDGLVLSENEFNKVINDTLSELVNLEYLILKGLTNLNSLDFVKSTDNKGTTKLIELDLRGTKVKDLTPLNSLKKLVQLFINNGESNLSEIQETINRLTGSTKSFYSGVFTDDTVNATGLNLGYSSDLFRELGNCTEITSLYFKFQNRNVNSAHDLSLDLSKCSNLKKLDLSHAGIKSVVFPSNLEDLNVYWAKNNGITDIPSFANLTKLRSITLNAISQDGNIDPNTIFTQLEDSIDLRSLIWREFDHSDFSFNFVFPKLESIISSVHQVSGNYKKVSVAFTNADIGVSMKTISMNGFNITNCDIFSKFLNLNHLNVGENNISNLNGLSNLKDLDTLYLNDNSLSDTFTYLDESGQSVTKNNLDILANLNKTGKLRKLYLSGNMGIINYSPIKDLPWTEWSGFNGR